MTQYR